MFIRSPNSDERFLSKFFKSKVSGCWIWTDSLDSYGYGRLYLDELTVKAHRYSYEFHTKPIKEGLLVLHKCNERSCVNPNHLYEGTAKDNNVDMDNSGNRPCQKGSNNNRSKLTEQDVILIKTIKNLLPTWLSDRKGNIKYLTKSN